MDYLLVRREIPAITPQPMSVEIISHPGDFFVVVATTAFCLASQSAVDESVVLAAVMAKVGANDVGIGVTCVAVCAPPVTVIRFVFVATLLPSVFVAISVTVYVPAVE